MSNLTDDVDLLSLDETRRVAGGLSRPTVYRLVAAGTFPSPIVLSRRTDGRPSRIAWVRGEVREWCRRQIQSNRTGPAAA
jgi:predicted DNA-binding transcriptional regulator AlpA